MSEIEIVEDVQARNKIRECPLRRHPGAQGEVWDAQYAPSADSASLADGSANCRLDIRDPRPTHAMAQAGTCTTYISTSP